MLWTRVATPHTGGPALGQSTNSNYASTSRCRRWRTVCQAGRGRGSPVVEPVEPNVEPKPVVEPRPQPVMPEVRPTGPGGSVSKRYKPFLDEWDRCFIDAVEEPGGYYMQLVQGQVPHELEGTLFRNGPGKFTIGGREIDHPYDGDGFVVSMTISGGKVFFRSRFVQTAEYKAEAQRGEVLFRGTFATQRRGHPLSNVLDLYVKNTSNTNVVCWGGKLLSLFEAGQPYELDPGSLRTMGLEDLRGHLPPGLPFDMGSRPANGVLGSLASLHQKRLGTAASLPPELFRAGGEAATAHPHLDSNTGRLVGFSYQVRPGGLLGGPLMATQFHFWELDSEGRMAAERRYDMPGFAFLHDFCVTENYYVFFQNPVTVNNAAYLFGTAPAGSCVRWVQNVPTEVHVVPRPGAAPHLSPRTFTAPPCFIFHHANGYEAQGGRKIVLDSIHYDSLPAVGKEALAQQGVDGDVAFKSRLRRVELDLDSGSLSVRTHFSAYLEMPAINEAYFGRKHRYVYGYKSDFDNPQIGIAKIDTEQRQADVWMPGYQRFASEPKFVPRPGATAEDDGWLLTVVNHSGCSKRGRGTSYLVILDATNVRAGPVAVLQHRSCVPSGLHGSFVPACHGLPHWE